MALKWYSEEAHRVVVEDGCLQALLHILPIHIRLHCLVLLGRVLLSDTGRVSAPEYTLINPPQ